MVNTCKYQSWTESAVLWALNCDPFPFGCRLRCHCSLPHFRLMSGPTFWELEASGCSMGASSLWLAATCLFHGMVQLLSLPLLPPIWEYLDFGDFVERTWKKKTNTWLVMFSYDQGLLRSPFKAWLDSIAQRARNAQQSPSDAGCSSAWLVVCDGKRTVFGPLHAELNSQDMTFCWQLLTATGMCRYGRELSLIGFETLNVHDYAAYPLLKIQVLLDFAMNLERTKKNEQHMVAPGTTKVSSTPDLRSTRWCKVVPQLAKLVYSSSIYGISWYFYSWWGA